MPDGSAPAGVVDHETGHWTGVGAVALVVGGLGVLLGAPSLVLSGLVGVAFAGAAGTARPLGLHDAEGEPVLAVRRRLDEPAPDPGEAVTVTVEVCNEGTVLLPDVRIVDGVPPELEVTDGSPRHGTVLRPGASTVFSYTVAATRGEHDWQPAAVAVADPTGSIERETSVDAATTLTCSLPALSSEALPLRALATPLPGRLRTDTGGPGTEFHSTREYRPGDPPNRIDWRRRARTGDLGTVEFHQERAATVMLVIDTRKTAYLAPGAGAYHAVERSVDAANRTFRALLDAGDRAGIATFGPAADECWLPPDAGDEHRVRGRALLTSHPALSPIPPAKGLYETYQSDRRAELKRRRIERLHRRLSADTQVFLFSPCCDGYVLDVARRLDAYGHLVTVVSPDPTTADAPSRELAGMERVDRLAGLREAGVRVIDWEHGEPFSSTLARAQARWSS